MAVIVHLSTCINSVVRDWLRLTRLPRMLGSLELMKKVQEFAAYTLLYIITIEALID